MSGSLKQYEKWAEQNPYDRTETMKAWRAALEWIETELDKAGDGFEPDLGLRNLLKKELKETENEHINKHGECTR